MVSPSPALPGGAVVPSLRTERQDGAQAPGVMLNPTVLQFSLSPQYLSPVQPHPLFPQGLLNPSGSEEAGA